MSIGLGHRARVGQLYPSGGLCDFEVQLMAPDGVQFVTTRMPFRDTSRESDVAVVRDVEAHARLVADAKVELIAFNCTAASLLVGPDAINTRIMAATGIRSTTTIEAVLAALRAVRATRIALVTPYRPEVVAEERDFLVGEGFSIVAEAHSPCPDPVSQGTTPPEQWLRLAATLDTGDCDAVLFSCAGIYISGVVERIEDRLSLPVITSNAALLWHVLNLLDLPEPVKGYGVLLQRRYPELRDGNE